jgi:hypothetical protein
MINRACNGARHSDQIPSEEMMAGRIQRTTGPQPLREQADGKFAWAIPVSGVPSREWMKLFNTPGEPDDVYMPSLVDFRDRGFVLVATEEQIPKWMRYLDQWIATANEGVAEAETRRLDAAEREERGHQASKQRVADADKYRDL